MRTTDTPPLLAYFLGLCCSFGVAGLVIVAFIVVAPSQATTYLVPVLASALLASIFSLIWPAGGWRWSVLSSSGFWLFFSVVFFAYLSRRETNWLPVARAASVVLAGFAGSTAGILLRRSAKAR